MSKSLSFIVFTISLLVLSEGLTGFSSKYFANESQCIDSILMNPQNFYFIMNIFDESVCKSNISLDILNVFEQLHDSLQSPELFHLIISEFNERYKQGVTHTAQQSINTSSVLGSVQQTISSSFTKKSTRKNNLGKQVMNSTEMQSDQLNRTKTEKEEENKKQLDIGDSFHIDLNDFGIDFGSHLEIDSLQETSHYRNKSKKNIQFKNGGGMNYQIIHQKNQIGKVNFSKDKTDSDQKMGHSADLDKTQISTDKKIESKSGGSSKSSLINIDSPDVNLTDTDLDMAIDDLSHSNFKTDKSEIEFNKNKDIQINIVDKDPKEGTVIIEPSHAITHKSQTIRSSDIEEESESSSQNDDESNEMFTFFDPSKYKNIKRDPKMSHDSSIVLEDSDESVELSQTDVNIDDLRTKSLPNDLSIKIEKNNPSAKINIIEKNEKIRSVKVEIDSSSKTSIESETIEIDHSSASTHLDKVIKKNLSQKSSATISLTISSNTISEETTSEHTHNEFSEKSDKPSTIDDYHNFTDKKNKKYLGKTIVALQFTKVERRLAGLIGQDSKQKRRDILKMFSLLPKCLQKLLFACKPQIATKIKECQKDSNLKCDLQGFQTFRECSGTETFINGACYSNCPSDMTDHSLYCHKRKSKQRYPTRVTQEDPLDSETEELWADNWKVVQCSVFGPSYTDLGPDLCIQKCPYGWKDLGRLCEKPFRFKNHKSFLLETVNDQ